jgi:NAD(P)-dependent dehydrogenase (short-subunit alcohol dehydrogenase family)
MTTQTQGRFAGRVALVTGATAGIGEAAAIAYARDGARVVVNGNNADRGNTVVEKIRSQGGEAMFYRADVSSSAEVEAMVDATVEAYGRLDFGFNNAGIIGEGTDLLHEYPDDVWQRVIDVNVKGVWLCMKYQLTQMLAQEPIGPSQGAIVNMSSIAGLVATASAAYDASKHAVIGLTKSAALIYADQGVRINAICPAGVKTPMLERAAEKNPNFEKEGKKLHPVGRVANPEEVADAVLWLCSDLAAFVTGSNLVIDGGWTAQ